MAWRVLLNGFRGFFTKAGVDQAIERHGKMIFHPSNEAKAQNYLQITR